MKAFRYALILFIASGLSGCTSNPPEPANLTTAESALKRVLDLWIKGQYPAVHRQAQLEYFEKEGKAVFLDADLGADLDSAHKLHSYTIQSREERELGRFVFAVAVEVEPISRPLYLRPWESARVKKNKSYFVLQNKKSKWVIADSESMEFQKQLLGQ